MAPHVDPVLSQVSVHAVQWLDGRCLLLDQTRLPSEESYLHCSTYHEVVVGIQALAVRGAPAIGIAGAYACVLALKESEAVAKENRTAFLEKALSAIENARPTAVNLAWAVKRMRAVLSLGYATALNEAQNLHREDVLANLASAKHGASLLPKGKAVLTCCNTGDLATGGIGTAFGVFHEAHRLGHVTKVFACETRPVLQGLRLTAWELHRAQIPFTVICDNMVASLMKKGEIGSVITGADRIAANGDVANKIGTYSLAVLAKHHRIPFLVAAPSSTFDLDTPNGECIRIEQRNDEEVLNILGTNRPKFNVPVYNPAFDVTPSELITAIICEKGVLEAPDTKKLKSLLGRAS